MATSINNQSFVLHSLKMESPSDQVTPFFSPLTLELGVFLGKDRFEHLRLSKPEFDSKGVWTFQSDSLEVLSDGKSPLSPISSFEFCESSRHLVIVRDTQVFVQKMRLPKRGSDLKGESRAVNLVGLPNPSSSKPVKAQLVPFKGASD